MATPTPEELNKFCGTYHELNASAKRLSQIRSVLTVLLVVVILGFVWSIFSKFREMYTVENFKSPMQAQMETLGPRLLSSVQNIARDAYPQIVQSGYAAFQKVRPELEIKAHEEMTKFTSFAGKHLDYQITAALHRVSDYQEERLIPRFPRLADPAAKLMFKRNMETKVRAMASDLLQNLHEQLFPHVQKLEKSIARFRTARFEKPDHKDDLALYYTHLWLMALDQYLMLNSGTYTKAIPETKPMGAVVQEESKHTANPVTDKPAETPAPSKPDDKK